MRTRLRRIIALAAVSVFAAVVAAGPTALAHDRKDGKHDRGRKYERDRGHHHKKKTRRLHIRSYVELNRQVDLLTRQLAALGQLPSPSEVAALKATVDSMNADVKALTLSVDSMNTQWSSTMGQLKTRVDALETSVLALEAGGGSGGGAPMPALYDANEQKVGNVISVDQNGSAPWVAFKEGDHFFALKAVGDDRGFANNGLPTTRLAGAIVRFTELGCTGQAYLDPFDSNTVVSPPVGPFALALAGVNDNHGLGPVLIYVAPANAAVVFVAAQSMVDGFGFCVRTSNGSLPGIPAVMTLESMYTPPYTVK